MPDPEVTTKLPIGVQLAIDGGVLIATALAAMVTALRRPREEPTQSAATKTDVLVTGGSFNDARPMREAVDELRRFNATLTELAQIGRDLLNVQRDMVETMQDAAIEERVEREVHARMTAIVVGKDSLSQKTGQR